MDFIEVACVDTTVLDAYSRVRSIKGKGKDGKNGISNPASRAIEEVDPGYACFMLNAGLYIYICRPVRSRYIAYQICALVASGEFGRGSANIFPKRR